MHSTRMPTLTADLCHRLPFSAPYYTGQDARHSPTDLCGRRGGPSHLVARTIEETTPHHDNLQQHRRHGHQHDKSARDTALGTTVGRRPNHHGGRPLQTRGRPQRRNARKDSTNGHGASCGCIFHHGSTMPLSFPRYSSLHDSNTHPAIPYTIVAEKQAQRRIAAGSRVWCFMEDLQHLHKHGSKVEARSL
jgi:hypothetical protein